MLLYINLFCLVSGAGEKDYIALASTSTIAENLILLGAASNVIVVQNLETKKYESVSSLEFIKLDFPLTLLNAYISVFKVFLALLTNNC